MHDRVAQLQEVACAIRVSPVRCLLSMVGTLTCCWWIYIYIMPEKFSQAHKGVGRKKALQCFVGVGKWRAPQCLSVEKGCDTVSVAFTSKHKVFPQQPGEF